MKYSFLSILFAVIVLTSGCLKEHNELVPNLEGVPAGGLTHVNILSVENDTAEIEIGIFAVDHLGGFIGKLSQNQFEIEGVAPGYEFSITDFSEKQQENRGSFSVALDFDQSGSISGSDPFNARIDAGVSFSQKVSGGDEAAVFAFTSGSQYLSPHQMLVDFSQNSDELASAIESLEGKTGGGTPLYQSIYDLIPIVAANSKNENKAIIAFTDGQNTSSGPSVNTIIEAACAKNVRLYTVGLSNSVDNGVLSELAFETKGAVMIAEQADQLIAQYSSLGKLLHGEARYYNLRLRVIKSSGNWRIGDILSAILSLRLPNNKRLKFFIQRTLLNKHLGAWYSKLPTCPCTYDDAKDLLLSVCSGGEWFDCGKSDLLIDYHYGATYEVRWVPEDADAPGQQCTYDANKLLITSGIAAGSPDLDSPDICGFGDIVDGKGFFDGGHWLLDVKTWGELLGVPCHQYLNEWPANTGNNCGISNSLTDIRHMPNLVGEMTCEEVTQLFKIVDNTPNIDSALKDYIHDRSNWTPNNLIDLLKDLKSKADCDNFDCDVIDTAIENLR